MTTTRRTALALVLVAVALCVLPSAALAAGATAQPEQGPLSPAFVEALHDPLVGLGLGHVPSPVEVHVDASVQARAALAPEPTSYDLRAPDDLHPQGRLTPVKDQGSYSTCWAFANIAALESRVLTDDPAAAPDFSEDNLISRSGFGLSPAWRYDFGGYDFMAVAYFTRWDGPVSEADDPYPSGHSRPGPVPTTNTTVAHVQGVAMVPGRTSWKDNSLIKELVRRNGALSVGMYMNWDAHGHQSVDGTGRVQAAYYLNRAAGENHGVNIVGWDDRYPRKYFRRGARPPGPGAFLVRNTWGPDFGDGGYFWVSYYDRSFAREQGLGGLGGGVSYADVRGTDDYAAVYQHDSLGVTDHWGYRAPRVWGASRFAAAADQSIAAAAFYTLASSTRYRVFAGRTLKTMTLRASGATALPGYTTVDFTEPLGVTAGKKFVVAVKLYSPHESYPLAIERPARQWMRGARAKLGEGYISRDGTKWKDVTRVLPNTSVCIKAFAR